ncbi:MAG: NUDIX domain-containing protein [Actinobacteria bacterium]|nr:NUDIX domain-containing protein [Actinomycetota bacterium]
MNDRTHGATDSEFLANYDPAEFERPSVAVDVALLTVADGVLRVLLVEREEPPQAGRWALPGTFVRMDESLEDAARRALATKAHAADVFLEQLYTFGAPERDPRTRVLSVAYYALVDAGRLAHADLRRIRVPWEGEDGGPVEVVATDGEALSLAFDHAEILGVVVKRLRGKLDYSPIGFQLLPECFTLRQLQDVHETILGRPLNKDSFRRRMLASGQLEATGQREDEVEHRPAELYRFVHRSAV